MKLTLKQARRAEREIGTELGKLVVSRHQVSVSIYEDVRSKVNEIQKQTLENLKKIQQLASIRFAIRKAIETENEVSGLNKLMNREAELKVLDAAIENISVIELTDDALEIAVQRHAATKASHEKGTVVQSRYGEATDEITIPATLRTQTLEDIRAAAKAIQRELRDVADQQAALNVGRTIELHDADAKTLEEAGIVL